MGGVLPFIIGVIPLYFLFIVTFTSWYLAIGNLFLNKMFLAGILVAYSLPAIVVVIDFLASKKQGESVLKIAHLFSLIFLAIFYAAIPFALSKTFLNFVTPESIVGIGLISLVMSIMLYPIAETKLYHEYKRPFFVAGVIFMALFVAIASYGVTITTPLIKELHHIEEAGDLTREQFFAKATQELTVPAYILLALLVGFWASAAWLASSKTQGFYVPGLELRPMMAFRPDFILPGGVNFVKGTLLTGIGLILMIHNDPTLPRWNWWGFVLAFLGIMMLIPFRGMFKMLLRRERLLGNMEAMGVGINWVKESLLFVGLLFLLYGFLNAFKSIVPFTELIPSISDWPGIIPFALSFAILVPLRGYYKLRLFEGAETSAQLLLKQLLLLLGVIFAVLGFAVTFEHKIHVTPTSLNFATNPLDFKIGAVIFTLGATLILFFRPMALRNEFYATIRMMPGLISQLPEETRRQVIKKRLEVLAGCDAHQRFNQMKPMMEGLNSLPEDDRKSLRRSMMECLAELHEVQRKVLMPTMDEIM